MKFWPMRLLRQARRGISKHQRPRLTVEPLEERCVPAAFLFVNVYDGELEILDNPSGDADHSVEITQGSTPDEFHVTNLSNGDTLVASGVTEGIRIDLGFGHDRVRMTGVTVPGDLRIVGEEVIVRDSHILGEMTLEGYSDDGYLEFVDNTVEGCAEVRGSSGVFDLRDSTFRDDLSLETLRLGNTAILLTSIGVEGDLSTGYWRPNIGNPLSPFSSYYLVIDGCALQGDVEIRHAGFREDGLGKAILRNTGFYGEFSMGEAPFYLEELTVDNCCFWDDVSFNATATSVNFEDTTFRDQAEINAGWYCLDFDISRCVFEGEVGLAMAPDTSIGLLDSEPPVLSGPGTNLFIWESTFHDLIDVDASHLNDLVEVGRSTFHDELDIDLGDGDDVMRVWDTTFHGILDVQGGDQFDTLVFQPGVRINPNNLEMDGIDLLQTTGTSSSSGLHAAPPLPTSGPRVISHSASRQNMIVTFSETITAASFTRADVSITDGNGTPVTVNTVTPIVNSNGRSFNVQFASSSTGGYRLVIGPDVTDVNGDPMNQDGDSVNGETTSVNGAAAQDQFLFRNTAGPKVVASAPSNGLIRVTFNEAVDASTFTTDDVELCDLKGTQLTVTAVTAAPFSDGKAFDVQVTTMPVGGYTLLVGSKLTDRLGNEMNQDGDAVNGEASQDQYRVTFRDSTAPTVLGLTEVRPFFGVTVTFSEPTDVTTFTLANVSIVDTNTGQTVPIDSVRMVPNSNGRSFDIRFAADVGDYRIRIKPNVMDVLGNAMTAKWQTTFAIDLLPRSETSAQGRGFDPSPLLERVVSQLDLYNPLWDELLMLEALVNPRFEVLSGPTTNPLASEPEVRLLLSEALRSGRVSFEASDVLMTDRVGAARDEFFAALGRDSKR